LGNKENSLEAFHILQKYSDEENILAMPEIISHLEQ
jgi:hypothetical protein